MLSESRKNRVKLLWSDFSLNPRGELWKKDKQNFGSKLMKKMGWKNGEGLGKNGSGITVPIRLDKTFDHKGLGYSKRISDYSSNWVCHQDDFNSLLSKLQGEHSASSEDHTSDPSTSSANSHCAVDLEKKSKKSRKRVHYQRTIQGKNMSNCSQADWKCILGNDRKLKHKQGSDEDIQEVAETNQSSLKTSTISSYTYFLKKRVKLEAAREENETSEELLDQVVPKDVSDCNNHFSEDTDLVSLNSSVKRKRKKKKKKRRKRLKEEHKEEETLEDVHLVPTPDYKLEKENQCQAEDSLIVFRKVKKKMKKKKIRANLKAISDMTNFEQGSKTHILDREIPLKSDHCSTVGRTGDGVKIKCILKPKQTDSLELDFEQNSVRPQKKCVRFMDKPMVGYVPRKDSVRGGAWIYKLKLKSCKV